MAMRQSPTLHVQLLALLRKYGKVSNASVSALLEGVHLVQSGLRLAYLVDSLSLHEDSLTDLQILLNQESKPEETVYVFHEGHTSQTFIINASLAATCHTITIPRNYIAVSSGKTTSLDGQTNRIVSHVLRLVSDHAQSPQCHTEALVVNLADSPSMAIESEDGNTPTSIRHAMITLTGILLEYPFIYYVPPDLRDREAQSALKGRPLMLVELQAIPPGSTVPASVIKFSVPQAFKQENEGIFTQALQVTLATYQARLDRQIVSGKPQILLKWNITENLVLDNVAL